MFVVVVLRERAGQRASAGRGEAAVFRSDIGWVVLAVVALGVAHINIWNYGAHHIQSSYFA